MLPQERTSHRPPLRLLLLQPARSSYPARALRLRQVQLLQLVRSIFFRLNLNRMTLQERNLLLLPLHLLSAVTSSVRDPRSAIHQIHQVHYIENLNWVLPNIEAANIVPMAARTRPRGPPQKEDAADAHEERNMWTQIVNDLRGLKVINAKAKEIEGQILKMEAEMGPCM